mmetsp:Transcript_28683/g.89186  ORF Transcript_28683/g.89186 Transcript_28683/m.89186 type:complete len:327 (-) Transcript_28683:407-1387(-)
MPALAMIFLRVHCIVSRRQDLVRRFEGRWVLAEDLLAIPDDPEPVVAPMRADVCDHEPVPLDHGAPHGDAHGRARRGVAPSVPETAVDVEQLRPDEVVLAGGGDRVRGPVHAVKRDHVGVSEDGALAHDLRLVPDDLGDVVPTRLAPARVDLAPPVTHGLEGDALRLVGEHNGLATKMGNARPAAIVQGHVVERSARANAHGTGQYDRCPSLPEASEVACHDLGKWLSGCCWGGGRRGGQTSDTMALATVLLLCVRPCSLPVVDAGLAIKVASGGRGKRRWHAGRWLGPRCGGCWRWCRGRCWGWRRGGHRGGRRGLRTWASNTKV